METLIEYIKFELYFIFLQIYIIKMLEGSKILKHKAIPRNY